MTDDLKERLKVVACCDTDSTMRHFAYAFMEQDPDGDYVTYAAAKARITDLEARLAAAVEVQDRLMSERYQHYLRAEAAEAGEDALAEALQCWVEEEEGKGRSGTITVYNTLAAYEARRMG